MTIEFLNGSPEALRKKLNPQLFAEPARRFLLRAALYLQGEARGNAPVDTGRLRSSIAYEIDSSPMPLFAEVGSAVGYARFMEYGTGALSDNPGAVGDWGFPSGDDLNTWARRHGFASGAQVASIIRRNGGLRPRRYLRAAFEHAREQIAGFLAAMAREIEQRWAQ